MRILFLDDNQTRHKTFKSQTIGASVDQAFTAIQAVEFLKNNTYDVVFLDHDLGEEHYKNQNCNDDTTGQFVAKYCESVKEQFNNTVFVLHTLNPVGRESMKSILENAGFGVRVYPFTSMFNVEVLNDCLVLQ